MAALLQDLRYCLRGLAASPGFAAIVLLTMGLGTGANATVFSVMSTLLLRPPAGVSEPSRLALVYTREKDGTPGLGHASYEDYQALAARANAFESLAATADDTISTLGVDKISERVRHAAVTGDFFTVLGVRPASGRLFTREDDGAAGPPPAVIGHDLWQRVFGARDPIAGQVVTVDDRPYTIVGVAPAAFHGLHVGRPCDVWTLLPDAFRRDERDRRALSIVGRLRAGLGVSDAQRQIDRLIVDGGIGTSSVGSSSNSGGAAIRDGNRRNSGASAVNGGSGNNASTSAAPAMSVLRYSRLDPAFRREIVLIGGVVFGATGLVLVIACANVASLLLSRATARRREMAVRFALGASRGRLLRQLLTESLTMAIAGAALGLLCAYWTATALPALFSPEQAELLTTRIDARVWIFTTALAILSGVSFGVAPAAQATRQLQVAALRSDASDVTDVQGATRARAVLVIAQVALSCILVVATGLLVRSLQHALRGDLGAAAPQMAVVAVRLPGGYGDPIRGLKYQSAALDRIREVPGIQAATWMGTLPLASTIRRPFYLPTADGEAPEGTEPLELDTNSVSYDYFETMQVAMAAGRAFNARDGMRDAPVVIVDEELARRYFDGDAVGKVLIEPRQLRRLRIVGVVRSGKFRTLQDAPQPTVYYPLVQCPLGRCYTPSLTLVARSAGDPRASIDVIQQELRRLDEDALVLRALTFEAHLSESLASDKITIVLVGACGLLAVTLAMIGVYGVMTDAVVRRTREIGVRLALGARPLQVVRLIFLEGLRLTTAGVVLGVAGGAAAARLLTFLLHGVEAIDPATLAITPALLLVMAIVAVLVPARRALRVNPLTVLREQ